jgi:hypothetical protein
MPIATEKLDKLNSRTRYPSALRNAQPSSKRYFNLKIIDQQNGELFAAVARYEGMQRRFTYTKLITKHKFSNGRMAHRKANSEIIFPTAKEYTKRPTTEPEAMSFTRLRRFLNQCEVNPTEPQKHSPMPNPK